MEKTRVRVDCSQCGPGHDRGDGHCGRHGKRLKGAGSGYVCKRCGTPSPTGVGYVDQTVPGRVSAGLDACECGYSVRS